MRKAKSTSSAKGSSASKPGTSAATGKPKPNSSRASVSRAAGGQTPADASPGVMTSVSEPVVLGPALRKRELIERVVERSGVKKRDAKPVIEAMLEELGQAISENRELVLPPFGKLKVTRKKPLQNGQAFTARLRQNTRSKTGSLEAAE